MKYVVKFFVSVITLSSHFSTSATEVGMISDHFVPTHRSEAANYFIWYPAIADGKIVTYGDNPIMYGKQARKNATPQSGKFPLVVLSHGGGGNAGQLGWLTEALVRAGYVVAAANHPGSTTGNASAKGILSLWQRPQDISQLLDRLGTHPSVSQKIDFADITALGFSAGGYTVLSLAGARPDVDKLIRYCEVSNKGKMTDNFCQLLFKTGGEDIFQQIDWQPAGKDYRDKRINKIIAIDPGVSDAIRLETLKKMPEALLINLGEGDIQSVVDAKPLAKKMPKAIYQQIADANHFSFLALCKPNAKAILAEEGEGDPLCDSPTGAQRSRQQVHQQLIDIILAFLKR